MTAAVLNPAARYRCDSSPGVAWRILGPEVETFFDAYGEELGGVETGMVLAVMVGDDRVHIVDPDDLTVIGEDDYCSCCGQIGCGWS